MLRQTETEERSPVEAELPPTGVQLAVYDISNGWAKILSPLLLCKWIELAPHTSVIVFGQEYFWAGGIQKMAHEEFCEQTGHRPVQLLDMGPTEIPEDLFQDFILTVSSRYTAETYDLLNNNCNNFSQECAQFLVGKDIPEHILQAGAKVQASCLGRLVLGIAGLSPATRAGCAISAEAGLAFVGLLVLLLMDVAVFGMLLGWAVALLWALASAYLTGIACWLPLQWLEPLVNGILGFLLYTMAVCLSVLHSTLWRVYDGCHGHNRNFGLLSAGLAMSWVLCGVMLLSKLTTRVSFATRLLLRNPPPDTPGGRELMDNPVRLDENETAAPYATVSSSQDQQGLL